MRHPKFYVHLAEPDAPLSPAPRPPKPDYKAIQREQVGGLFSLPASREATLDRERRAGRRLR